MRACARFADRFLLEDVTMRGGGSETFVLSIVKAHERDLPPKSISINHQLHTLSLQRQHQRECLVSCAHLNIGNILVAIRQRPPPLIRLSVTVMSLNNRPRKNKGSTTSR